MQKSRVSNFTISLERPSLTMSINKILLSLSSQILLSLLATLLISIVVFPISYVEASNNVDFTKWASITGQNEGDLRNRYNSMNNTEKNTIADKFTNMKKLEKVKKDVSNWDIKSLQTDDSAWTKLIWTFIGKAPGGNVFSKVRDTYRWLDKGSCQGYLYAMKGKFKTFVSNRRNSDDNDPKGMDDAWTDWKYNELINDNPGTTKKRQCETKTTKEWKQMFEGGFQIIRGAEKGIEKIELELRIPILVYLEIKQISTTSPGPGAILEYEAWANYKHANKQNVTAKATWSVDSGSPAKMIDKGKLKIDNNAGNGIKFEVKAEYTSWGETVDGVTSVTVYIQNRKVKFIIKEKGTNKFIINMPVTIGGKSKTTDANGEVTITGYKPGTYSETIKVTGYKKASPVLTIPVANSVKEAKIPIVKYVELEKKIQLDRKVKFVIKDKNTKKLITNTAVTIGGKSKTTDTNGEVTITGYKPGTRQESIIATGYKKANPVLTIPIANSAKEAKVPIVKYVELEKKIQLDRKVKFIIKDKGTKKFIINTPVTIGGKSKTTDANGEVTVTGYKPGTHPETIKVTGYKEAKLVLTIPIANSAKEAKVPIVKYVNLEKKTQLDRKVKFVIKDKNTKKLITNTAVTIGGKSKTTDANGEVTVTGYKPGMHTETIKVTGYKEAKPVFTVPVAKNKNDAKVPIIETVFVEVESKIIVPDLIRMTESQARTAIGSALKLVVSYSKIYRPDFNPGEIIIQTPDAGTEVENGEKVSVVINRSLIASIGIKIDPKSYSYPIGTTLKFSEEVQNMDPNNTYSFTWDIEGNIKTGSTIKYTFDKPGHFKVRLYMESSDPNESDTTYEIIIIGPPSDGPIEGPKSETEKTGEDSFPLTQFKDWHGGTRNKFRVELSDDKLRVYGQSYNDEEQSFCDPILVPGADIPHVSSFDFEVGEIWNMSNTGYLIYESLSGVLKYVVLGLDDTKRFGSQKDYCPDFEVKQSGTIEAYNYMPHSQQMELVKVPGTMTKEKEIARLIWKKKIGNRIETWEGFLGKYRTSIYDRKRIDIREITEQKIDTVEEQKQPDGKFTFDVVITKAFNQIAINVYFDNMNRNHKYEMTASVELDEVFRTSWNQSDSGKNTYGVEEFHLDNIFPKPLESSYDLVVKEYDERGKHTGVRVEKILDLTEYVITSETESVEKDFSFNAIPKYSYDGLPAGINIEFNNTKRDYLYVLTIAGSTKEAKRWMKEFGEGGPEKGYIKVESLKPMQESYTFTITEYKIVYQRREETGRRFTTDFTWGKLPEGDIIVEIIPDKGSDYYTDDGFTVKVDARNCGNNLEYTWKVNDMLTNNSGTQFHENISHFRWKMLSNGKYTVEVTVKNSKTGKVYPPASKTIIIRERPKEIADSITDYTPHGDYFSIKFSDGDGVVNCPEDPVRIKKRKYPQFVLFKPGPLRTFHNKNNGDCDGYRWTIKYPIKGGGYKEKTVYYFAYQNTYKKRNFEEFHKSFYFYWEGIPFDFPGKYVITMQPLFRDRIKREDRPVRNSCTRTIIVSEVRPSDVYYSVKDRRPFALDEIEKKKREQDDFIKDGETITVLDPKTKESLTEDKPYSGSEEPELLVPEINLAEFTGPDTVELGQTITFSLAHHDSDNIYVFKLNPPGKRSFSTTRETFSLPVISEKGFVLGTNVIHMKLVDKKTAETHTFEMKVFVKKSTTKSTPILETPPYGVNMAEFEGPDSVEIYKPVVFRIKTYNSDYRYVWTLGVTGTIVGLGETESCIFPKPSLIDTTQTIVLVAKNMKTGKKYEYKKTVYVAGSKYLQSESGEHILIPSEQIRQADPAYGSNCYLFQGMILRACGPFDNDDNPKISKLMLYEDGKPLGPAHSNHMSIGSTGKGQFCHWINYLLFSSSDNSDPGTNGRKYSFACVEKQERKVDKSKEFSRLLIEGKLEDANKVIELLSIEEAERLLNGLTSEETGNLLDVDLSKESEQIDSYKKIGDTGRHYKTLSEEARDAILAHHKSVKIKRIKNLLAKGKAVEANKIIESLPDKEAESILSELTSEEMDELLDVDLSNEFVKLEERSGVILEDNFNDNIFDTNKWIHIGISKKIPWVDKQGASVNEANGVLTISEDRTDAGGAVKSVPFTVKRGEVLKLSRSLRVFPKDNFRNTSAFITKKGKPVAQYRYFYKYKDFADGVYFADGGKERVTIPWGEWFSEIVTYNTKTGETTYSIPGRGKMSRRFGTLPVSTFRLLFDAYGWKTGHKVEIDYIKLEKIE